MDRVYKQINCNIIEMAQAFKRYWTPLTIKEILHKTMKSFITFFMNLLNLQKAKHLTLFGWEQRQTGPYPSHCCKTSVTLMLVAYQCPPNFKRHRPFVPTTFHLQICPCKYSKMNSRGRCKAICWAWAKD